MSETINQQWTMLAARSYEQVTRNVSAAMAQGCYIGEDEAHTTKIHDSVCRVLGVPKKPALHFTYIGKPTTELKEKFGYPQAD